MTSSPDPITGQEAIALKTEQRFEVERMTRLVDQTHDLDTLRNLAKNFLHLWYQQKAATNWVIHNQWRHQK